MVKAVFLARRMNRMLVFRLTTPPLGPSTNLQTTRPDASIRRPHPPALDTARIHLAVCRPDPRHPGHRFSPGDSLPRLNPFVSGFEFSCIFFPNGSQGGKFSAPRMHRVAFSLPSVTVLEMLGERPDLAFSAFARKRPMVSRRFGPAPSTPNSTFLPLPSRHADTETPDSHLRTSP